jgi:Tol biopolymer transport system component
MDAPRTLILLAAVAALFAYASAVWADDDAGIIAPPPPPAGDIAYVSTEFLNEVLSVDVFTMTDTGAGQTRRTTEGGVLPDWSPDGNKIVFSTARDGNNEVYTMDADGDNQTNISNRSDNDWAGAWSPDGTKIAFYTYRDGNAEIYVMDPDGGNQTNLTHFAAADDRLPSWSPDGSKIAFFRENVLWIMNADGSNQTEVYALPTSVLYPVSWRPDAGRLVFSRKDNPNIWAIEPDGSGLTSLFEGSAPDYAPFGNRIVFERDDDIYTADEDGGNQDQLTNTEFREGQPSWKPIAILIPAITPTDTAPGPTGTPEPDNLGDVNCDGMVNAIDAAFLLQLLAGLVGNLPCPQNADVNEDGQTNAVDAALILQYTAGLISDLPP